MFTVRLLLAKSSAAGLASCQGKLTEIEDAAKESRRETLRFWLVLVFGIIGACIAAWAVIEGWFTN
jgi:hypothetical protein